MDPRSEQLQRRLSELAQQFLENLPGVIDEVHALQRQAQTEGGRHIRRLRMKMHRIAGSAATFGYRGVAQWARSADSALAADIADKRDRPSVESLAVVQRATEEMYQPHQTAPKIHLDADPHERHQISRPGLEDRSFRAGRKPRLVVVAGSVPGMGDDTADQLAVFGLSVLQIGSDDDLLGNIDTFLHSAGEEEADYLILVATVGAMSGNTAAQSAVRSLRDRYGDRFIAAFVGEGNDFDTRIRAVRFHADSFLNVPFEITEFIDRIETLISEREADPFHVMIVDDDPEQVSATALLLQSAGMITSVVTDPHNIFQVLVEAKPELILMDMYMPECSGAELASVLRQNDSFVGIPIVFLSVESDPVRQMEALRSGADDFLTKPIDSDRLITSVRMRAARNRAMRFYMERDSLTGLLNHTNLKQRLGDDLSRARRVGTELVFAMIDIDHFKSVNDTYGHLTGDRVLKALSRLLSERLRRTDVVGRYGGEEFGIVLFNTDGETAQKIIDELRESFSRLKHVSGDQEFSVTFSSGLAEFPVFETSADIGEAADRALYQAKETGRNRVIVSTPEILGG